MGGPGSRRATELPRSGEFCLACDAARRAGRRQPAVLDAARERWAGEGYAIEERTDPNGIQRLFASKDDGTFRQIALGANVIILQGSTACLPEER